MPQCVHIDIFITNVFHPNDVIDTECVDRRRCSFLSLYPHIEVVISCTRRFVEDVIECVDRGRRTFGYLSIQNTNIVITYNSRL